MSFPFRPQSGAIRPRRRGGIPDFDLACDKASRKFDAGRSRGYVGGVTRSLRTALSTFILAAAALLALQGMRAHGASRDTAFYPFIDLFERVVLRFQRPESPADKLRKLEEFFLQSGLPLEDALPHFCSMLSIPPDAGHEFPDLPPDQQKQQTMLALQSILRRRAAKQPVLFVVEDLQWVDPTTVEFLTQLIEHIHEARILALFTCRPEFRNPWTGGPNVSEVNLTRLPPTHATELIRRVAGGKTLPYEIVADVVTKTDGVPLFIEELTKTVLESGLVEEESHRYQLAGPLPPLAIPNTLHDSLMARLDRLSTIKALAQLSAAIGRALPALIVPPAESSNPGYM